MIAWIIRAAETFNEAAVSQAPLIAQKIATFKPSVAENNILITQVLRFLTFFLTAVL